MSHLAPTQFASVPEHGRRLDRPRSCPSVCGARPFVPAPLRSTAGPGAHRLRHHLLCRQRLHLPARGEPLAGTLAVALPGAAHSPRRRLLVHRLRARQRAGVRVAPHPHAPSSHSSRLCPQAVTLPRWYAWQHCRELQDMSTFQKCARSMQAQRRGSRPPCARTDSARWQPWVGRGSTCAPYPDVPKPDGSCCTATGCACTRARPASVTTLVYTQNWLFPSEHTCRAPSPVTYTSTTARRPSALCSQTRPAPRSYDMQALPALRSTWIINRATTAPVAARLGVLLRGVPILSATTAARALLRAHEAARRSVAGLPHGVRLRWFMRSRVKQGAMLPGFSHDLVICATGRVCLQDVLMQAGVQRYEGDRSAEMWPIIYQGTKPLQA